MSADPNNLYATVSGIRQNPQVKALSEGWVGSVAFLDNGGDVVAGQAMQSALSVAAPGQITGFAAMGGHSLRYETGSHVDVNGFSLLVGAAGQKINKQGTQTGGLFLEAGRGNYSTFNQFAGRPDVRGDGDTRYFGVGWLGRSQKQNGRYFEGSLRAGQVGNKFHSGDFGTNAVDYDVNVPYYGLHIGFGREKSLDDRRKLDLYTKLLWTHQNGSSATVAGDAFDFAAVNSLRWQAGAMLSSRVGEETPLRAGLAYQYEFDGKADSAVNGSAVEAPSLQGGVGIVELGVTRESKNGKGASLDFSLQGLFGKAKGIAGNLRASWKF